MKVDTILVGLHIDHDVQYLIDLSLELSFMTKSDITFLHVFRPDIKTQEEVNNQVLVSHFNQLKKLVESSPKHENHNTKIDYIVETGFATEKLLTIAEELKPDILILGILPSQSTLSTHFASIARPILNHWHGRVLLVPNSFNLESFNDIVFTIDFQFQELGFLMDILVLAELLFAHVTCLHIINDDEDMYEVEMNMQIMKKLFHREIKHELLSFNTMAGKTSSSIEAYVNQGQVDMVCMVSNERSLFGSMISPSNTYRLSNSIQVPIFISKSNTSADIIVQKV